MKKKLSKYANGASMSEPCRDGNGNIIDCVTGKPIRNINFIDNVPEPKVGFTPIVGPGGVPLDEVAPSDPAYDAYNKDIANRSMYLQNNPQLESAALGTGNSYNMSNYDPSKEYKEKQFGETSSWFDKNRKSVEKVSMLAFSGLNKILGDRNTKRNEETGFRQALMQTTFAPLMNPYAYGNGSQAIMANGGMLIDPPTKKNKAEDPDPFGHNDPNIFNKKKLTANKARRDLNNTLNNSNYSYYTGIGGIEGRPPTTMETMVGFIEYMKHNKSDQWDEPSNVYRPQFQHITGDPLAQIPMAKDGIHIDPKNKGKFNATKKRTGKSTEELTHSDDVLTRKRAIFAQNAKKWHHGEDGLSLNSDQPETNILWGGKAEQISDSSVSNPMMLFKGNTHPEGGIGIQHGSQKAEVEHDEVGWVDPQGALNIFGKLNVPGTNKKFKTVAKGLAKAEDKVDSNKIKSLQIINNVDPADSYNGTAFNTAKVMFQSQQKQAMDIANKKQELANYQNMILSMGEIPTGANGLRMDQFPDGTALSPYSLEQQDKMQKDYTNFYKNFNRPPLNRKDDGYDAYYHELLSRIPTQDRWRGAWTERKIGGDPNVVTILDGDQNTPPTKRKNRQYAWENINEPYKPNTNEAARIAEVMMNRNNKEIKFFEKGGRLDFAENGIQLDANGDPILPGKFKKVKEDAEALLKQMYPGKKVEIVYNTGRDIKTQRGLKANKSSMTDVSLHNFGAATDYTIKIDGKIVPGNTAEGKSLYQNTVWKAAKSNGLYNLDWANDPYHISAVPEGGKSPGGAFKNLLKQYPEVINTQEYKNSLAYLEQAVNSNQATKSEINAYKQLTGKNVTAKPFNYDPKSYSAKSDPNQVQLGENFFDKNSMFTFPTRQAPINVSTPSTIGTTPDQPVVTETPASPVKINESPTGVKSYYEAPPLDQSLTLDNTSRARNTQSPLDARQLVGETLTLLSNNRDPVNRLSYQPDLKQTFDLSYQLGRNENQSGFNQAARIAESTGNVDALSNLASQLYKSNENYNMQEVQANATQKLGVYGQNVDTLNQAKIFNLNGLAKQQDEIAAGKFNQRKELVSSLSSIADKSLKNTLENRTYNAYANLFPDYGFDSRGNVTFDRTQAVRWNSGSSEAYLTSQNKALPNKTTTVTDANGNVKKVTTVDSDLEEYNLIMSNKGLDDNEKKKVLAQRKNSIYLNLGG